MASDQNKAKPVSRPSIGNSRSSVRARLTILSRPSMAESKINIPPPIGLLETDRRSLLTHLFYLVRGAGREPGACWGDFPRPGARLLRVKKRVAVAYGSRARFH